MGVMYRLIACLSKQSEILGVVIIPIYRLLKFENKNRRNISNIVILSYIKLFDSHIHKMSDNVVNNSRINIINR